MNVNPAAGTPCFVAYPKSGNAKGSGNIKDDGDGRVVCEPAEENLGFENLFDSERKPVPSKKPAAGDVCTISYKAGVDVVEREGVAGDKGTCYALKDKARAEKKQKPHPKPKESRREQNNSKPWSNGAPSGGNVYVGTGFRLGSPINSEQALVGVDLLWGNYGFQIGGTFTTGWLGGGKKNPYGLNRGGGQSYQFGLAGKYNFSGINNSWFHANAYVEAKLGVDIVDGHNMSYVPRRPEIVSDGAFYFAGQGGVNATARAKGVGDFSLTFAVQLGGSVSGERQNFIPQFLAGLSYGLAEVR
ncbi:hypothetical protein A2291_01405 [candidate division WOR-1 bacterium RIFOXYB2_FULL_42_35]|uniref:Uncharacterized protein n=1 Tax=candidate division WOR-1 bacterium RIFOXYC2_FULL_41_25 TaxID=1802586 RepID=A0A1F4TLX5_UNCSA|nr:MAG: hypothetical protein A2247_07880 [candidate division WOR-1 bacterium RIFOXYA2_FULL_41_14]OGC22773.1 MAG: hypothetical protein A2291_01405 [candidate division WOR-1 bacterium RIFOXYB2_FULL_42_35]OGC33696.1 MAG: hypothetical protein A2462_03730 [candidate division WOR-1 bacterium RIFOXYC2_FULL_41_25]